MIDLDQTLLRADKTYDRQRFKDILNQCKEAGILVCIATGNTYHKIEDYFDEESRQDLYFACDNGNYIVKNDETLEIIGIGHDVFLDIAKFVDQFEDYHIAMSVGPHLYFRESSGRIYDHVKQYHDDIKVVESFHDIPNSELVTKIAMYSEVSLDQNKVLTRILNERYHEVAAVTSGGGWVDVYSIHGGKGSAAQYLQGKYDLEARHTMAFGDSLNDQSMMPYADYSIAMANADPDLADWCNYQVGSNEEQAVIQVLESFFETGNLNFLDAYRR